MTLPSHRLFLALTLLLLGSCSRGPEEDPIPGLPYRFFPLKGREHVILDETIADEHAVKNWRVLVDREGIRSFLPIAEYRESLEGGESKLGRAMGYARVVDIPANVDAEAIAHFSFSGKKPEGVCLPFFVTPLVVDDAVPATDLDSIFATWSARIVRQQSEWMKDLDPEGNALAYLKFKKSEIPTRYVAMCALPSPPFTLLGLQVRESFKGKEPVALARMSIAASNLPLEQRVQALRIADDVRRCIVLAPGAELVFETRAPAGKLAFELGLACEPNESAERRTTRVDLTVEVEHPETREKLFAPLDSVYLAIGSKVTPMFSDHTFPLPDRLSKDTPVRINLSVMGGSGVIVAEPILRELQPQHAKKNLLLISIDTLRQDTLGCYGYHRNTTPFLDQLASKGARFGNVTGVGPYTLPTHATILTGLFPQRHGAVHTLDRFVSERVAYLPRLMRAAGYHTAAFTGGGYVSDVFGFDGGFDRFSIADPLRLEDFHLDTLDPSRKAFRLKYGLPGAAEWIEQRGTEPWFLFLHTFIAHEYKAPQEFLERFDSKPETTPGRTFPQWFLEDHWRTEQASPGDVAHLRDRYDATVSYGDQMLRDLFARLESSGRLANTVVVVLSDHGEEFFEHGGLRHSVTLYEEMVRIPWIITGPGIAPTTLVKEPVSQADVFPTLLELVDLEIPEGLDGHSRVATLRHDLSDFVETPLFSHVATQYSRRSSLRRGPWKVIKNDAAIEGFHEASSPLELYDLRADPTEATNLSASQKAEVRNMLGGLDTIESYLRARSVGSANVVLDAQLDAQLRQLGYIR